MADQEDLNKVQVSTEYDKFKFLDTNRNINKSHLNALKADIAAHPEILRIQPILVNENFFVIDGQHRFHAAKELELPIYYLMAPKAGMAVTRRLNVLQRGWTPDDFARSFAAAGDENYKFYLEMMRKYGFTHTITMIFLRGGDTGGTTNTQSFRRGELQVANKVEAEKLLSMFAGVVNMVPVKPNGVMAKAFVQITKNAAFDYDRLINKLEQNEGKNFYRSTAYRDFLHMFEDAYNWSQSGGKIRLY